MANKLNQLLCATSYGNTGYGSCILDPKKFAGAIEVPKNFEIAEADLGDLQEFLIEKTHAAIGSRIFPYPKFITVTDSTEDPTINTTDYGFKLKIRDGFYDWTFRYQNGGVLLHNELAKNEGSDKAFLFYDSANVLYGYKSGGKLKGIPVDQFLVLPWKLNTGADTAQYLLRFIIDPIYLNFGNLGFLKIDGFNFLDVHGLEEVVLEQADLAANVVTVKAKTKISSVDMHEAYASNLAQTTAWAVENEDGSAITVTTVTDNPTDGGWDLTLNTGQFNASDKAYVKLAAPAVLRETPISVEGFDSSESLLVEAPGS